MPETKQVPSTTEDHLSLSEFIATHHLPEKLRRSLQPGDRAALSWADSLFPVCVPVELIEKWASCWTLPDGVRQPDDGTNAELHSGFGILRVPGDGGKTVLPMRLEFTWASPDEPIDVVFDLSHGLTGRYRFTRDDDGDVRFVDLLVTSGDGEDPLRRLNLGVLRKQLNIWLRHPFVVGNLGVGLTVPIRRPGRKGSDPVAYADWAARYVRAVAIDERRPARVIVNEAAAKGEHLTLRQVNNAVRRARDLGLLTASPPGKAGGELTATAVELLRDNGMGNMVDDERETAT